MCAQGAPLELPHDRVHIVGRDQRACRPRTATGRRRRVGVACARPAASRRAGHCDLPAGRCRRGDCEWRQAARRPAGGAHRGRADLIARFRRHPLARALRVDKLTLAALEATLHGPRTPTALALHADAGDLRARVDEVVARLGDDARVVPSDGQVGGGSGPGIALPGWAVSLPERYAARLRAGEPAVVGRLEGGRCLLDLRCVPASDDDTLVRAVLACR